MAHFPTLDGFGPTRKTLHVYTRAVGAILREHAIPHEKWWHIGLRVTPEGLVSDNVPLPNGGVIALRIDMQNHLIRLLSSDGAITSFDMAAGMTGSEMGQALIGAVAELGLHAEYQRERFTDNTPGTYEREVAGRFFTALVNADRVFKNHRAGLAGDVSPVNFWPHGFDLSMEWYGSRMVEHEEDGKVSHLPVQLNLGFYPGQSDDVAYFYSNPWPFESDQFTGYQLPGAATWHTNGWQGTYLPYEIVAASNEPEDYLLEFARAVYDIATPILDA